MPKKSLSAELIIALLLLSIIFVLMAYALFLSPYDIAEITDAGKLQAPSLAHPMGTDHLSRDLLVRVGYGGIYSILIALGIVSIGAGCGLLLGSLAAYFGGWTDWLISRFTDTLLAFPGMMMALLLITILGRGSGTLILALGIAFIPSFARVARSGMRELKQRNFVKRLEVMDASPARIIFLHMLPLLKDQFLDALVIGLANAILAESALSFLGFGIQAPKPSWGNLMSDAKAYLLKAPGYALFPGLAIVITVFALYLLRKGLFKGEV